MCRFELILACWSEEKHINRVSLFRVTVSLAWNFVVQGYFMPDVMVGIQVYSIYPSPPPF